MVELRERWCGGDSVHKQHKPKTQAAQNTQVDGRTFRSTLMSWSSVWSQLTTTLTLDKSLPSSPIMGLHSAGEGHTATTSKNPRHTSERHGRITPHTATNHTTPLHTATNHTTPHRNKSHHTSHSTPHRNKSHHTSLHTPPHTTSLHTLHATAVGMNAPDATKHADVAAKVDELVVQLLAECHLQHTHTHTHTHTRRDETDNQR